MDNRNNKMRNKRQKSQVNQWETASGEPLGIAQARIDAQANNKANLEIAEEFNQNYSLNKNNRKYNAVSEQVTKRLIAEALDKD